MQNILRITFQKDTRPPNTKILPARGGRGTSVMSVLLNYLSSTSYTNAKAFWEAGEADEEVHLRTARERKEYKGDQSEQIPKYFVVITCTGM